MNPQRDASDPPRLHRSRRERLLFGVCGGFAEYLDVDPAIVRLVFVVVGLIPPLSAVSVFGYAVLAVLMPGEGAEGLPPRDALRQNVTALRTEVEDLVDAARAGVARISQRRGAGAEALTPAAGPPAAGPPATDAPGARPSAMDGAPAGVAPEITDAPPAATPSGAGR
jgi:phage shock protein C